MFLVEVIGTRNDNTTPWVSTIQDVGRTQIDADQTIAVLLMLRILGLLKESGVTHGDALCALRGAEALLPAMELEPKPTMAIVTS